MTNFQLIYQAADGNPATAHFIAENETEVHNCWPAKVLSLRKLWDVYPPHRRSYTIRETAEVMGVGVSKVQELVHAGELKLCAKVRMIKDTEIDRLLEEKR